jgi:hypothetical protein
MSLSALFEVQNTQITNPPTPSDFLRSLLGTLAEFDQFIGSGAEKAGVGMMMGLVDTEARGKMVCHLLHMDIPFRRLLHREIYFVHPGRHAGPELTGTLS